VARAVLVGPVDPAVAVRVAAAAEEGRAAADRKE
jgi:hypothetical protein